ncbi:hypothetical protein [Haladaptatus sp. W1]|uniref:hypothetical protein n=1 Tax=Haladaptatus sp. W1 TaxID=1897478 RepID=UPI001112CE74|nr:hypothetical protein [Haladaptatus sp. W1]
MSGSSEYESGDRVEIRGRSTLDDETEEGTIIAIGQFVLSLPSDDPMVSGTSYSDSALIQFDESEYGVIQNSRLVQKVEEE